MKSLALIAILLAATTDSCRSRWRAAENNRRYGPWGPSITFEQERAELEAREKAAAEKAASP